MLDLSDVPDDVWQQTREVPARLRRADLTRVSSTEHLLKDLRRIPPMKLRSIRFGQKAALTLLATSVHVPLADCPAPSAASTTGRLQPAMPDPESPSVPLNETVTFVLFQPLAFGPGDFVATAIGDVRSMLIAVTVFDLALPARSVQPPVTV